MSIIRLTGGGFAVGITGGMFTVVDEEDVCKIIDRTWFPKYHRRTIYAISSSRNPTNMKQTRHFRMHRLILGLSAGDKTIVDPIDGNGLNNRKSNLRICKSQNNSANQRIDRKGKYSSQYKGVSRLKSTWRVVITVNYKNIHLGCYADEIEAAKIYDDAAKRYFGEFARVNFPKGED